MANRQDGAVTAFPGADFDPGLTVKDLVRNARRGALATRDAESGAPYASLVAVATAADGAPLFLLSGLARHTKNLLAEPRAALLVEDVGIEDPLAGARATVSGVVSVTDNPDERRRYLARHASSASFAGFGDFAMWRLEQESAHLVAGFGRIQTLPREKIMTDLTGADALLAGEESAVSHMNEDHADALSLYATNLLGGPAGAWRCDGLDPEGLELSAGGRALYLRFPQRVDSGGALRKILVDLADQARAI